MSTRERVEREKTHGEFLASEGAEEIWNWNSCAGRRRARRRGDFFLDHLNRDMIALELGCGTGVFTRIAAESGAKIIATDVSEVLLDQARQNTDLSTVEHETADAHALHYEDQSFDLVFGSSILHHLEPETALQEIYRVLKPGCWMVFAEPNMLNPQIWAERNIPWVRRKTGTSPDETAFVHFVLAKQLRRMGYVDVEVRPHDFLHPAVPGPLVSVTDRFSRFLETMPILRNVAGSLLIKGRRAAGEPRDAD